MGGGKVEKTQDETVCEKVKIILGSGWLIYKTTYSNNVSVSGIK